MAGAEDGGHLGDGGEKVGALTVDEGDRNAAVDVVFQLAVAAKERGVLDETANAVGDRLGGKKSQHSSF